MDVCREAMLPPPLTNELIIFDLGMGGGWTHELMLEMAGKLVVC
jgi:hypothetical protein